MSSRRPCSAAAARRSACRPPAARTRAARHSRSGSSWRRRPMTIAAIAIVTASPSTNTQYASGGRAVEVDQPREVGGGEVGEHRQRRDADHSVDRGSSPRWSASTAPTHSTAWRTTKATATGATMSSRYCAASSRSASHAARSSPVAGPSAARSNRRPSIDAGRSTPARSRIVGAMSTRVTMPVRRVLAERRSPGSTVGCPQTGHREVDLAPPVVRRDHQDRVASRDRPSSRSDDDEVVGARAAPPPADHPLIGGPPRRA